MLKKYSVLRYLWFRKELAHFISVVFRGQATFQCARGSSYPWQRGWEVAAGDIWVWGSFEKSSSSKSSWDCGKLGEGKRAELTSLCFPWLWRQSTTKFLNWAHKTWQMTWDSQHQNPDCQKLFGSEVTASSKFSPLLQQVFMTLLLSKFWICVCCFYFRILWTP